MERISRYLVAIMIFLVTVLGVASFVKWKLPDNVSTYGGPIDDLWYLILWITGVLFVATEAILIWTILKYPHAGGEKADHIHSHRQLEMTWTIATGAILLFLAVIQADTWASIKMRIPEGKEVVRVQVYAKQFDWDFRMPGRDGKFGTGDDVYLPTNTLIVPKGRPVVLELRSGDMIHSFFLPHLRYKQDVLPGRAITTWVQATTSTDEYRKKLVAKAAKGDAGAMEAAKSWEFPIACAELCGAQHSEMGGVVQILEPGAFDDWYERASRKVAHRKRPLRQYRNLWGAVGKAFKGWDDSVKLEAPKPLKGKKTH